jgi:hypothetical protein
MSLVDGIRDKVARGQLEFSRHAVDQMLLRRISVTEIQVAISVAEVIEDYPDDKYGPSCLLFGLTRADRPVHIQCSHPSRPLIKIVTAYEPDPDQWIDGRQRLV